VDWDVGLALEFGVVAVSDSPWEVKGNVSFIPGQRGGKLILSRCARRLLSSADGGSRILYGYVKYIYIHLIII
jgi:hypothetical protein